MTSRPPETTSTVVAIFPRWAGARSLLLVTSRPSRSRVVRAASAASSVQPSSTAPPGGPANGIRWSHSQASSSSGNSSASSHTRRISSQDRCIGVVLTPKRSMLSETSTDMTVTLTDRQPD